MSLLRLGDPGLADADILLAGEIVVRGNAQPNQTPCQTPQFLLSLGVSPKSRLRIHNRRVRPCSRCKVQGQAGNALQIARSAVPLD